MTIKDIAEKSGVSVSTVSRVLNDHPDVSKANRARVMAVVRELHYVPNSSARDLVRPQSDAVGLVVRGVGNPFYTAVIRAIEQAVGSAGYTLVLHQIHTEDDEIPAAAGLARAKKLRGLILLGGCFDYTPERIASLDVPFVCCSFTNSFGTLEQTAYSSVSIDDQAEARRAVNYLIEKGHRKIGILLDSTCDHSISQLRYRGYCQALEEAGLPLDRELVEETRDFDLESAYRGAARLAARRDDLTGLFVISDSMAVAAVKALHDGGKRVPEDCSVIAIDGIDLSAYMIPTLTTLIQPQAELGEKAVRLLTDLIEGRGENRQLQVRTALRAGDSVRVL